MRTPSPDRAWSAILLFLCASCAGHALQTFRGLWSIDTAGITFQACGSSEKWWAILDPAFQARAKTQAVTETTLVFVQQGDSLRPNLPEMPPPMLVEVQGDTSPAGRYGPGGVHRRQLTVHDFHRGAGACS